MLFGAGATWQVIAAVLGALVTLASEHQTQAQNAQMAIPRRFHFDGV
jgi:hypothetical protein